MSPEWTPDGKTKRSEGKMVKTKFKITGVDRNKRRFTIHTNSARHAASINLWRGSVWRLDEGHKWRLVYRVWN